MVGLIIGICAGGLVLLCVLGVILKYNSLVKSKNSVEKAFADVDVYLKKRYDLIPNLVNIVKGYAKHEKDVLENVVKLRNEAVSSQDINKTVALNNKMSSSLGKIRMLSEDYPSLRANENFLALQNELAEVEQQIAGVRVQYNSCATTFNTKQETFPGNIVAKMLKFKQAELFVIENPKERENVIIEF